MITPTEKLIATTALREEQEEEEEEASPLDMCVYCCFFFSRSFSKNVFFAANNHPEHKGDKKRGNFHIKTLN